MMTNFLFSASEFRKSPSVCLRALLTILNRTENCLAEGDYQYILQLVQHIRNVGGELQYTLMGDEYTTQLQYAAMYLLCAEVNRSAREDILTSILLCISRNIESGPTCALLLDMFGCFGSAGISTRVLCSFLSLFSLPVPREQLLHTMGTMTCSSLDFQPNHYFVLAGHGAGLASVAGDTFSSTNIHWPCDREYCFWTMFRSFDFQRMGAHLFMFQTPGGTIDIHFRGAFLAITTSDSSNCESTSVVDSFRFLPFTWYSIAVSHSKPRLPWGKSMMEVLVNGSTIFHAVVPFPSFRGPCSQAIFGWHFSGLLGPCLLMRGGSPSQQEQRQLLESQLGRAGANGVPPPHILSRLAIGYLATRTRDPVAAMLNMSAGVDGEYRDITPRGHCHGRMLQGSTVWTAPRCQEVLLSVGGVHALLALYMEHTPSIPPPPPP